MTYAETIATLPPVQRDAVLALQAHPGTEDLIADAVHANVPVEVTPPRRTGDRRADLASFREQAPAPGPRSIVAARNASRRSRRVRRT